VRCLFAACAAGLLLCGCQKKAKERKQGPVKVKVAEVKQEKIPVFVEAIGNVVAFNSAEIKARVEGELLEVHFRQGELVKENELLFTIDPRPYIATLQQKQAQYLETDANLQFARDKVERYGPLVKEDYVSQLDYDNYVTNKLMLEAQLAEMAADIEGAKVNLDYCYVRAPFSGMASKRLVDKGNMITNAGEELLLLNQIQPIYVDFSITEKDLIRTLEAQSNGPLAVHVQPQGCDKIFEGRVIVIGNQINTKTGMVPIRAQFENAQMLLWPGQFAKIHLILGHIEKALVAPESAVNIGQKGRYVFAVNASNTAEFKQVKVSEHLGNLYEITHGLEKGDMVVTDGQINLKPGHQVTIVHVDKDYVEALEHESF